MVGLECQLRYKFGCLVSECVVEALLPTLKEILVVELNFEYRSMLHKVWN